jgi:GST-like protein
VLNKRLGEAAYLAGASYSIADIATLPWINTALRLPTIGDLAQWPEIVRWRTVLLERPAVQRGLNAPKRD